MKNQATVLSPGDRVTSNMANIGQAVEEELGYVKAILHAITVLAKQDAETNAIEIASLANCAHWISDNLESNVDHFGEQVMVAAREVSEGSAK